MKENLNNHFKKKSFLIEEIHTEGKNDNFTRNNKIYVNKDINLLKSNSSKTNNSNIINNLNSYDNSSNFDCSKNQKKISENLSNNSFTNCNILKNKTRDSNNILISCQNKKYNIKNNFFHVINTKNRNDNLDIKENNYLQTDFGVLNKRNNYFSKNFLQDQYCDNNLTNTLNQNSTFNDDEEDINIYHPINDISNNLQLIKNRAEMVFQKYNSACFELRKIIEKMTSKKKEK